MSIASLRKFNQLAVKHIERFGTRDDLKILLEIGARQQAGERMTLKTLMLCCSVPESTLKRRLAKLVRQGFVIKEMTANDHRVHCYTVADKTMKLLHAFIDDIRAFEWP
ncbi:MarR family transcriptional regulator [Azospira restricta]|uniref:MarR family transcriptional regulator n=1 Tax=Azospira restricta TaxID=404405 RepID=A0A974PVV0_9RHOO|nr:MarR family transcriptional regulator [Azospira restricta]QRJ62442.1 MarR family transcriptional regulator [Azospira restricta]